MKNAQQVTRGIFNCRVSEYLKVYNSIKKSYNLTMNRFEIGN